MFYIPQTQKDDCGFTCLKMMLANLNNDKNYLFLPQENDHGPYSYSDLIAIAQKYGLNLQGIQTTEKSTLSNHKAFPFIASVTLPNGALHAVLVMKVNRDKVIYLDPRKGKVKMKLNDFLRIWDGSALLMESYEKKKCSYKITDPMTISNKIFLGIIQFIVGLLAIFGVYFIKDDTPIYVPAIFLSLAIITELILKALSYRIMKKLDSHYFSEGVIPDTGFRSYIEKYEKYKSLSLTSPMNYILLLVFSLALLFIILLNDRKNAFLAITPLLLAVIDSFLVSPYLKKKKMEIDELEEDLDSAKDALDLKNKVKVVHDKAYSYGYFDLAMRYVYAGAIVLTTLLTMRLCGISSFPYIIFYSCISLTLYKSISQLLSYGDKVQEYDLVKIKLNNETRKYIDK